MNKAGCVFYPDFKEGQIPEGVPRLTVMWPPSYNDMRKPARCKRGGKLILRLVNTPEARDYYLLAVPLASIEWGRRGPIDTPTRVVLYLYPPHRKTMDIDNRIKPVLDVLVKAGVLKTDAHRVVKSIVVHWCEPGSGTDRPGEYVGVYLVPLK